MTNQIALTLLILIAALFVADAVWLHAGLPTMVGKGLDDFIDYLAFWN